MQETEAVEILHHPGMNQSIEVGQSLRVGEYTSCQTSLVNLPIGRKDTVTKKGTHFCKKVPVVIVGSSHFIGHKGGNTQSGELSNDGAFSTAHPTCDANLFHSTI